LGGAVEKHCKSMRPFFPNISYLFDFVGFPRFPWERQRFQALRCFLGLFAQRISNFSPTRAAAALSLSARH
jgi:hypothetical protein